MIYWIFHVLTGIVEKTFSQNLISKGKGGKRNALASQEIAKLDINGSYFLAFLNVLLFG